MTKKDDPTPLQTVTITAERMIRAPLAMICTAIIGVVGATFYCTCLWIDVQELKRDMGEVKAAVRQICSSRPAISMNDHAQDSTP